MTPSGDCYQLEVAGGGGSTEPPNLQEGGGLETGLLGRESHVVVTVRRATENGDPGLWEWILLDPRIPEGPRSCGGVLSPPVCLGRPSFRSHLQYHLLQEARPVEVNSSNHLLPEASAPPTQVYSLNLLDTQRLRARIPLRHSPVMSPWASHFPLCLTVLWRKGD